MRTDSNARRADSRGRIVFDKDVLRVGTWLVHGKQWHVTEEVLRKLVMSFQRARQHGIRIPIVWNHSADARDKLGEVIRLYVRSSTLRALFWLGRRTDADRLMATAAEVSVEVAEPWIDGAGRRYEMFLKHVAVVHHPVISGQELFRPIEGPSAVRRTSRGDGKMEEQFEGSIDTASPDPVSTETAREIADLVNQIVSALGTSHQLNADATGAELLEDLRDLRDRIEAMVAASMTEPQTVMSASLTDRLDAVTRQLACERRQATEDRRRHFATAVDRLIHDGRLVPADKDSLLSAAQQAGYSLSLLAPFERTERPHSVPTSPRARRAASGNPPGVGAKTTLNAERVRAIVAQFSS